MFAKFDESQLTTKAERKILAEAKAELAAEQAAREAAIQAEAAAADSAQDTAIIPGQPEAAARAE